MTTSAVQKRSGWLASAPVDAVLAFGWLPFYAWFATTPLVGPTGTAGFQASFEDAAIVALAINFIHRHFVYALFFGDPVKRTHHPRAIWAAPVVVVVMVAAKLAPTFVFNDVLGILGAWNIWHTLMQRHGIFRAYAAKAGLEHTRGALDLALLTSLTLTTAAMIIAFDQDTFWGYARTAWRALPLVPQHRELQLGLVVVTSVLALVVAAAWLKRELASSSRASRAPRFLYLLSTVGLMAVLALNGPVVGFIVFSIAHSLEYILFVHLYTNKRARADDAPLSIRALGRRAPVLVVSTVLLAAFALAHQVWTVPIFVVYYTTTSALHYFYDGVIWKMRRPDVRAPLIAAS